MQALTVRTENLVICPLTLADAAFVLELVNSPGWLKYIGSRNLHVVADARQYIEKVLENPQVSYWTVRDKETQCPIGMITLIKRTYLSSHDLGFAFLPQYSGKNYAYESASAILKSVLQLPEHQSVSAICLPENTKSIRLLERLGFQFSKVITADKEVLNLYEISN